MMNTGKNMSYRHNETAGLVAFFLVAAISISVIAAWITHVVVCLQTASWGFLIAGAILFPIAAIHGYGIWFGFF